MTTGYIVDNLTAADILEADPPTHKLSYPGGGMIAMCWLGSDAARLAKGLQALETSEQGPQLTIDPATANFSTLSLQPGRILKFKTTVTLPESEILTRAREAAIASAASLGRSYGLDNIRAGSCDGQVDIRAAARALRDLAKPLSEVVPAVDGDLIEARRLVSRHHVDSDEDMVLAAIRRGRELGMIEAAKIVRSTVVSSPADSFEAHVRNELADTVLATVDQALAGKSEVES